MSYKNLFMHHIKDILNANYCINIKNLLPKPSD